VFLALFLRSHPPGVGAGVIISLAVGISWIVWLRGFRLEIGNEDLSYRNRLYRSMIVPPSEVREVKNTWIDWTLLTTMAQSQIDWLSTQNHFEEKASNERLKS
jgi:hypothetical protein